MKHPLILLCALGLLSSSAIWAAPLETPDDHFKRIVSASPAGHYEQGERRTGVYSVNDVAVCSRWAVADFYKLQAAPINSTRLLNDEELVWDTKDFTIKPWAAKYNISYWSKAINKGIDFLIRNGDTTPSGHYICLGMAKFASVNANSMGLGFLIFDPQIFMDLNHNPNRTSYSMDAIAMHEFAHQLQYWTNEPVLNDMRNGQRYSRRSELQADCVSAALLAAMESPALGKYWQTERGGVVEAVKSVGDIEIESRDHHGTPYERELAASYGLRISEKYLETVHFTMGLTSKYMLDSCRSYINNMDKLFGNPWTSIAR